MGKLSASLLRWKVLRVRHVGQKIVQQLLHGGIGELAICIAPFTVGLVDGAVRLTAENAVFLHGHTAALADQPERLAQERMDGHAEKIGQLPQCIDPRQSGSGIT